MATISDWEADLQANDLDAQLAAAEALAGASIDAQPAIVALVQACGTKSEEVRNWCVAALEDVGAPTTGQLDDLTSLASSANQDVTFWAVTLLGRAGEQAAGALPILVERLQNTASPNVQKRAAWALRKLGRNAETTLNALRKAAASGGPVAAQAQRAIERLEAL